MGERAVETMTASGMGCSFRCAGRRCLTKRLLIAKRLLSIPHVRHSRQHLLVKDPFE
jgi:hypothetical protein